MERSFVTFLLCVALGGVSFDSTIVRADENADSTAQESINPDSVKSVAGEADKRAEKRAKGRAALYVVFGIALVGLVSILAVLVIGRTIRRRVRHTPTCPSVNDPLWHLRKADDAGTGLASDENRDDTLIE